MFFRLIEIALFGEKPAASHGDEHHGETLPVKISEAPLHMLLPAIVIAVSLPLIGLYNTQIIELISRTLAGAFPNFLIP